MPAETPPPLLKANLKHLKLPTMLSAWEKLAREAAAQNEGGTRPTCCVWPRSR
ncbi:hypothetical protein R5W24_006464 [Gemmata sp. JC717]|uniref:hypothetical protein n=1 Tax=Gemmata algarum TaxID=2975278 RepID=UPI0028E0A257|nr:hypothetical protein [Gemmata algarum]MDY3557276.1 hypothetical protein [Gemmata algarum]